MRKRRAESGTRKAGELITFAHCGVIAGRCALRIYFWILPVAVLGSSLTKVTVCGALKCARFARANSSSSPSSACAPCLRTTKACGASPQHLCANRLPILIAAVFHKIFLRRVSRHPLSRRRFRRMPLQSCRSVGKRASVCQRGQESPAFAKPTSRQAEIRGQGSENFFADGKLLCS